jgi:phosphoribosyl 1,2-cyclic phosphodiesterase
MNYKIISSGSKGNAVIIEDVLVDCGVSFRLLQDELYFVKYLLITHTHSDHLKIQTFNNIRRMFPRIKVIGNYEIHMACDVDIIANAGFNVVTKGHTFTPFECVHDVLTYGFTWEHDGKRIIYATDTSNLDNAPDGKYDYFFLESNHDEKKLEAARDEYHGSYNPFMGGKRHLSTQQAKAFYYMNRRNKEAELIELHKSMRFY